MVGEYQHKNIAQKAWEGTSIVEQLSNIGSEIFRATKWQSKNKTDYAMKAFERGLELIDISIDNICNMPEEGDGRNSRRASLREITRMREVICDFFVGENIYGSDSDSINKYFFQFALANNRDK